MKLNTTQARIIKALKELDLSFADSWWEFNNLTVRVGEPKPDVKEAAMHKARLSPTMAMFFNKKEKDLSRAWLKGHGFSESL